VRPSSTPRALAAHIGRQGDQLLDDLRRLDRPVLVAAQGLLQQVRERACLDDVPARTRLDLARWQLPQELHREVPLGHPADLGEELVREDRDVGPLQPCRGEDIDHLVRGDRPVASDRGHRVVDERADRGLRRAGPQVGPAGLLGHPESHLVQLPCPWFAWAPGLPQLRVPAYRVVMEAEGRARPQASSRWSILRRTLGR